MFTCIALFIYFLRSFIHILNDHEIFLNFLRILTGENYKESERWTKLKMKDTTLEFALENLFID